VNEEPVIEDTGIPTRRLAPKDHLKRAAHSQLGSATEHYHLMAAIGEALARIEEHLTRGPS
jgi:hypothetical protein